MQITTFMGEYKGIFRKSITKKTKPLLRKGSLRNKIILVYVARDKNMLVTVNRRVDNAIH